MENWALTVICIAVAYVIFSLSVYRLFGKRKRVREIRNKMFAYNKELTSAIKSKDEKRIAELQARHKELLPLVYESLKYQLLPMLIVLPTLWLTVSVINSTWNNHAIELGFGIPIFHSEITYSAIELFWLIVIPMGIVSSLVYSIIEKSKFEKELEDKNKEKQK